MYVRTSTARFIFEKVLVPNLIKVVEESSKKFQVVQELWLLPRMGKKYREFEMGFKRLSAIEIGTN